MTVYNFRFPILGKLRLLSIWQRGKSSKGDRFLFENEEGTEKFFLWFEDNNLGFKGTIKINYSRNIEKKDFVIPVHVKLGVYNYYKKPKQTPITVISEFDLQIEKWIKSNPILPEDLNGSSYYHVEASKVSYIPIEKE